MLTKTRIPPAVWIIIFSIILSVAVYFRFWQLESLLVLGPKQGRALLAGRNILHGQLLFSGPATGISKVSLGPLYYYLTATALVISNYQPWGPALMVSGLGVITIMGLAMYGTLTKNLYFGFALALMAAISPLLAWQSRIPLETSLLPLFTVGWLVSLTWWIKSKKIWALVSSLVFIVFALQTNLSALILLVTTMVMVVDLKTTKHRNLVKYFKTVLISSLFGALAGKLLAGASITPASYWWQTWQQLTVDVNWLSAIWLIMALVGLYQLWNNRQQAPSKLIIWWLLFSFFGFNIMYVRETPDLASLFIVPSLLSLYFVETLVNKFKLVNKQPALLLATSLLVFLSLGCQYWLLQKPRNQVNKLTQQVELVIGLAQHQDFNFIYRGHLDIYDAADDHYQYLMWLQGTEPNQSARRYLKEPYLETWLLEPHGRADQTIVMYYPAPVANQYPPLGDRYYYPDLALELIKVN